MMKMRWVTRDGRQVLQEREMEFVGTGGGDGYLKYTDTWFDVQSHVENPTNLVCCFKMAEYRHDCNRMKWVFCPWCNSAVKGVVI